MYMYSKCNSNFKFNRKPWPKDYTVIHPGELLIWYYRYCKVWINKVLKMFWNKNASNMKDFLLKFMKTEINELKKKKVFNLSSAQKEIHTGEWGPECLKSWTKGRLGPLGKLQSINPVHQNRLKWLQIGLQMTLEASRPL